MTEQADIGSAGQPDGQQPGASEAQTTGWVPPTAAPAGQEWTGSSAAQRPELMLGAAFAGGVLAAMILKRLAR